MPLVTHIVCDGCRTTKKDTTQWYTMTRRQETAEVSPLHFRADGRPYAERDGLQQYFCGRYCLIAALTKWMDELTLIPASTPVFKQTTLVVAAQAARQEPRAEMAGPASQTLSKI
jgi:hypothetical protein